MPSTALCPLCAIVGEYYEIENAQDGEEDYQHFPPEVNQLRSPNPELQRHYQYRREWLLQCPTCGAYFWYRNWAPGGSEDVMRTYIHEAVRRLNALEVRKALDEALYKSFREAQEHERYAAAYVETQQGVAQVKAHLQKQYRAVVEAALAQLEHKYAYSEELAQTLELWSPGRDHSKQLAEARQREEAVAQYHAEILAEYLAYWPPKRFPKTVLRRLQARLSDNNAEVVRVLKVAIRKLMRANPTLIESVQKNPRSHTKGHEENPRRGAKKKT